MLKFVFVLILVFMSLVVGMLMEMYYTEKDEEEKKEHLFDIVKYGIIVIALSVWLSLT